MIHKTSGPQFVGRAAKTIEDQGDMWEQEEKKTYSKATEWLYISERAGCPSPNQGTKPKPLVCNFGANVSDSTKNFPAPCLVSKDKDELPKEQTSQIFEKLSLCGSREESLSH